MKNIFLTLCISLSIIAAFPILCCAAQMSYADGTLTVSGIKGSALAIQASYNEYGVLTNVKTHSIINGRNAVDAKMGDKIFLWSNLRGMEPICESLTITDTGSTGEGVITENDTMTEYLNNTIETADGTLHYTYYLPADYDESRTYPMLVTCPGWSSLFNTIETTPLTENRHAKENAEVWSELGGDMIVVSPSLTDWYDKSARQTLEVTEYFIENFPVDTSRVYASGFSAGGETLSRVVDKEPDLFAAYLHCASQWDGGYENAAKARMPVYVAMAVNDSYYHAEKAHEAYDGLKTAYKNEGITENEIDSLLVLDLKENSYFDKSVTDYHGGGYFIMQDKNIIKWMLGKTKSEGIR